jgi:predicted RNA-binding Zn-ribbon protein involved in translation (DUF1610 family)
MVKCPKCGAEIKYIPVGYTQSATGTLIVEPEYTEVINDNGRVIKGHLRHKCPNGGMIERPGEGRSRDREKLVTSCG